MRPGESGFVFLDLDHPVVAWAAYRAVLVSAEAAASGTEGRNPLLSLAAASMLSALGERGDERRLYNEMLIEGVRSLHSPACPSRFTGMFCFPDRPTAERAAREWRESEGHDTHFRADYLVEVGVYPLEGSRVAVVDSNWVTHAPRDAAGYLSPSDLGWAKSYWSGEPHPSRQPIWECIVSGRFAVYGTEHSERAYALIREHFPRSVALLEIARLGAWLDSDLGTVCAFLMDVGDRYVVRYAINMRDASDRAFLDRLREHKRSGGAMNWADLRVGEEQGAFWTPDLTPYSTVIPKALSPSGPHPGLPTSK